MKFNVKSISKKIIASFSFLFYLSFLNAQIMQNIKGTIIDADSKAPIPFANVYIENENPIIGTGSDIDGKFVLKNIPVGRKVLVVTFLGYEKYMNANIELTSGKEIDLTITLVEEVNNINAIVVTAKKRNQESELQVSSKEFSIEDTKRYAGSFNDPARMAQSFAGVSSADDENNEIVIRGNSPKGLLWRLDGIEIPNPNHFSNGDGGSGGGVSMISNAVLSNSNFLTGAFSSQYGNASSGVFDLKFRKGNTDKREYSVQVGLLGLQASLEGPMMKNSSYLVNYRFSTLTLLHKAGIKFGGENSIAPVFQDVNFKFHFQTKKTGTFSLFGLGGISAAGDNAVKDTLNWKNPYDNYQQEESHKTGIVALSHFYLLNNNKTSFKTIVSTSYEKNEVVTDSLTRKLVAENLETENFENISFRVSETFNHKFNAKNNLKIGATYSLLKYNSFLKSLNNYGVLSEKINENGNTSLAQAYVQWKHRFSKKLSINAGIHSMYLSLNNNFAIEPRISMAYKLNDKHSINYGFGKHTKSESPSVYLAKSTNNLQENIALGFQKSIHNVLAYKWNFAKDFNLKIEVYHQFLYDMPVAKDSSSFSLINESSGLVNTPMVNEGEGHNYGAELTLEKTFSDNYYFLVTASVFDSKYKALDNKWRNTKFNSNYIFNVLGGKEFIIGKKKMSTFGINTRLIWRGGYKTTPINIEKSKAQHKSIYFKDQAFESKAPDYIRLDFGIDYKQNKPKYAWTIALDFQNVINRKNLYKEYFNPVSNKIERVHYQGLVPNLNFKIDF